MSVRLKKGDKIWVRGSYGVKHYGIYIGRYFINGVVVHTVVHNSKTKRRVVVDALDRFARGRQVFIESRAVRGHERAVVDRALSYFGKAYDLLAFNCEHLVNIAQTGEYKSPQLRAAAGIAAFALAAWAVSSHDRSRRS